jgi:hypothetical protein
VARDPNLHHSLERKITLLKPHTTTSHTDNSGDIRVDALFMFLCFVGPPPRYLHIVVLYERSSFTTVEQVWSMSEHPVKHFAQREAHTKELRTCYNSYKSNETFLVSLSNRAPSNALLSDTLLFYLGASKYYTLLYYLYPNGRVAALDCQL